MMVGDHVQYGLGRDPEKAKRLGMARIWPRRVDMDAVMERKRKFNNIVVGWTGGVKMCVQLCGCLKRQVIRTPGRSFLPG